MSMNLPIYRLDINEFDEETGIDFVSLVEAPAVERDFQAFNNTQKFAIQDEEKRIVSGVAMVADMPIYRRDAIRGEYYVVFDKDSIFKIAKKWARSNKYDSVNAHHKTPIEEGVSLFESYIVDRERGVMPPKGYEDVADGSWFVSYLIDNDDVWAKVKAGEFKGFSVEGVFDFVSEVDEEMKVLEELKRVLAQWDGQ
jgi:hypothetical protein